MKLTAKEKLKIYVAVGKAVEEALEAFGEVRDTPGSLFWRLKGPGMDESVRYEVPNRALDLVASFRWYPGLSYTLECFEE